VALHRSFSAQSRAGTADDDFEQWVQPYWAMMHRIAWRAAGAAGDDVLQNAVIAAWRAWSQFDESRGTARAWLATITMNEARKSRRAVRRPVGLVLAGGPNAEANVDLRAAVNRLSGRQRTAVDLHYYVGLPVREVAEVMGCAEGTVKSTLSAARDRLRALLGEDYR
jgi:RNA polymerase sigma-70 factor (ECF subfamily)